MSRPGPQHQPGVERFSGFGGIKGVERHAARNALAYWRGGYRPLQFEG